MSEENMAQLSVILTKRGLNEIRPLRQTLASINDEPFFSSADDVSISALKSELDQYSISFVLSRGCWAYLSSILSKNSQHPWAYLLHILQGWKPTLLCAKILVKSTDVESLIDLTVTPTTHY
jgi:hypothetical protein